MEHTELEQDELNKPSFDQPNRQAVQTTGWAKKPGPFLKVHNSCI